MECAGGSNYRGEREPRSFWVNLLQSHPTRLPNRYPATRGTSRPPCTHVSGLWAVWEHFPGNRVMKNCHAAAPLRAGPFCSSPGILTQSSITRPGAQAGTLGLPHPLFPWRCLRKVHHTGPLCSISLPLPSTSHACILTASLVSPLLPVAFLSSQRDVGRE